MTKKLTAKERKARAQEKSREAVKVSRRSSKVTTYVSQKAKTPQKKKKRLHPSAMPQMRKPQGLSAEARFMELRPEGIDPLTWLSLFTPEEEIWEAIGEEVLYLSENGWIE